MERIWQVCWRTAIATLALLTALVGTVRAAQDRVIVPDLIGLTVPQAARAVADARLLFAGDTSQAWTPNARVQANLVGSQKPESGETVAPGSPVQVTVLRVYNLALLYDPSGLIIANLSSIPLDLNGVVFRSGSEPNLREFKIPSMQLPPKNCIRLWAKRSQTLSYPSECGAIRWSNVIILERQLFWLDSADSFRVERNGDRIASCPVSGSGCQLMLPQGDDPERTPYLSFAYRTNYLMVRNQSERWMSLAGAEVIGWNGKRYFLDDTQNMTVGDVPWKDNRLAPGQCIVYSELDPAALPPYDCQVVGYVKLVKGMQFWSTGFTVISPTGRRSPTCAGPGQGQLSLCVVRK